MRRWHQMPGLTSTFFISAPVPGELLTKDTVVPCRDRESSAWTAICKLSPILFCMYATLIIIPLSRKCAGQSGRVTDAIHLDNIEHWGQAVLFWPFGGLKRHFWLIWMKPKHTWPPSNRWGLTDNYSQPMKTPPQDRSPRVCQKSPVQWV